MQNNPAPPVPEDGLDNHVPQRRSVKLHQVMNVGNEARTANDGEALVYDASRGLWIPRNVVPGPGDISNEMLADGVVTETKMANLSVDTRALIDSSVTTNKIADNAISGSKIPDTTITDAKIGNRTAQEIAATNSTGTLSSLINGIAYMIKGITGKTSWRTLPDLTLEGLKSHKSRHISGGADPITASEIGAAPTVHVHNVAASNTAGFMSTAQYARLYDIGRHFSYSGGDFPMSTLTGAKVTNSLYADRYGMWLCVLNMHFSYTSGTTDKLVQAELRQGITGQNLPIGTAQYYILRSGQNHGTLLCVGMYEHTTSTPREIWAFGRTSETIVTVNTSLLTITYLGSTVVT